MDKHGKKLVEALKRRKTERPIHFIYGDVGAAERTQIRKLVESSNDAIIVASYGTFSTGMSIKKLHNVVFASPYKAKIRILQSIGRGLRKHESKSQMILWDVSDDISEDKHINYSLKHLVQRMKLYKSEGFEYVVEKVVL